MSEPRPPLVSRNARIVIGCLLLAIVALLAALLIAKVFLGPTTPHGSVLPSGSSTESGAGSAETLLAVGDIGSCEGTFDADVAQLAASLPGEIALLGDLAYPDGSAEDFARCFAPDWSPLRARLHPVPGNHEYNTPGASAYFDWFGTDAGSAGQGWYSYDLGAWHVVALNSECDAIGGCGSGSPELTWLLADLADHPSDCLVAYWHHPRFSSGLHGSQSFTDPLWDALQAAGADVILSGHEHSYERLVHDGVREFVVGTGGRSTYAMNKAELGGTEARHTGSYGLLRLDLADGAYAWQFLAVGGNPFADSGSGTCSGA